MAVVVATHGRAERLPELLDGLLAEPFSEILVVVNGGDDGSLALLRERAAQDSRLRPHAIEEAGKPAAVRRGVEAAASEVVLILDDDVIPLPGLAAGHARHHAARHGLVVVGYMPVARRSPRRRGEFGTELYHRAYEWVCDEYESDPDPSSRVSGEETSRCAGRMRCGCASAATRRAASRFGMRIAISACAAQRSGLQGTFDRALVAEHRHRLSRQTFLANMRRSGRDRWMLHHRHPEAVGSLPRRFLSSATCARRSGCCCVSANAAGVTGR